MACYALKYNTKFSRSFFHFQRLLYVNPTFDLFAATIKSCNFILFFFDKNFVFHQNQILVRFFVRISLKHFTFISYYFISLSFPYIFFGSPLKAQNGTQYTYCDLWNLRNHRKIIYLIKLRIIVSQFSMLFPSSDRLLFFIDKFYSFRPCHIQSVFKWITHLLESIY